MRKHRLFTIIASLLALTALASACGNAGADEAGAVDCDGDVAAMIADTEAEFEDARKDAKDAEGTPAESAATDRVDELEARLDGLNRCDEAPADSTTTAEAADCPNSWARKDSDKTGHRWFNGGVPSIAAASTPEEARAAAHDWANAVRTDPALLAGAARYLLDRQVDQGELFDSDGCATQTAVDLAAEMEAALALSQIRPEEAPASGHNSGTDGQQVTGAANPGITGDRRAILIEAPNGTKIWVMARCGNPVTVGPPPVPHGPTDEPTPPAPVTPDNPTPGPNPEPPGGPTPKDPSRDVLRNPGVPPQVQGPGTTPVGGDPGPATPPVDTPTGCIGPCPTTPSGGGGSTPSVPPQGTPGSGTSGDGSSLPPGGSSGISNPEPAPTSTIPWTGDPGGF